MDTILLVEDNEQIMEINEWYLTRRGYRVEKAYTVRYFMPILLQYLVIVRKVLAPAECPALLGKALFLAHLPFPSIIMPICSGSFISESFISLSLFLSLKKENISSPDYVIFI